MEMRQRHAMRWLFGAAYTKFPSAWWTDQFLKLVPTVITDSPCWITFTGDGNNCLAPSLGKAMVSVLATNIKGSPAYTCKDKGLDGWIRSLPADIIFSLLRLAHDDEEDAGEDREALESAYPKLKNDRIVRWLVGDDVEYAVVPIRDDEQDFSGPLVLAFNFNVPPAFEKRE